MKFAVDKVLNLWPLCLSESVTFLNDRLSLNMIMPIFHMQRTRFQRVEDAETILFLSKAEEPTQDEIDNEKKRRIKFGYSIFGWWEHWTSAAAMFFLLTTTKPMNVPAIMEQWPFLFQAHCCVVWSVVGHSYLIYWNIFDIFREYGRRQRTWETFLFQLKLRRHEIIWESLLLCTIWFARCLFSGMKLFERNFLMSWCYMRSRYL